MTNLIISYQGPERKNFLRELAEIIKLNDGLWLESRAASLSGYNVGLVRVRLPKVQKINFSKAVQAFEADGIELRLHEQTPGNTVLSSNVLALSVTALDRSGIVWELGNAIHKAGCSLEEISTNVHEGAMSGETIFEALVIVGMPPGYDENTLFAELEKLSDDISIDYQLEIEPE